MKAVLLDLPPRDAFALSLLIGKMRPDWHCQAAQATQTGSAPQGDLVVLDLAGWDKAAMQDDAATDARLAALLGDRAAVLLTRAVPAHDDAARAAADRQARRWAARGWTALRRPFRAADMREALAQAEPHMRAAASRSAAAPRAASLPPAMAERAATVPADPPTTFFSTSLFGPALGEPAAPQPLDALPPPAVGMGRLTLAQLRTCLGSSPHAACVHFLQALAARLHEGLPFEISLTMVNGLIFHPGEHWVAENTPLSVLRMVCRSRALVRHARFMPLNARVHPADRAAQRGMRLHALDDMLYTLAHMAECRLPEAY
ncbi:MAG: hypothetical protein Q4G71_14285 [Pseudomonadota bacterium]|nr:hypothetical protein [Pseudomonadota bacterium]